MDDLDTVTSADVPAEEDAVTSAESPADADAAFPADAPAELDRNSPVLGPSFQELSLSIGKPWQPGQSGNPGGMPKGTKAVQRAQARLKLLSPAAVKVLGELMVDRDSPANLRLKCVEMILERALGEASEDSGPLIIHGDVY